MDSEWAFSLVDEPYPLVANKQRGVSPEDTQMIREKIITLMDHGVFRNSKFSWAAQLLCVREKDGSLSFQVNWPKLNTVLVLGSAGPVDIPRISDNLTGKRYFIQTDLNSGFG